jgi:phage terminase Nu1 subunit (DNA packaging protein)
MAYVHAIPDPEWLDESQVSALTTIKVKTLQNWRCAGRGLPFHKLGGKVRYKKADVLGYIAEHRREPSVRASSRIAHDTY